MDFTLKTYRSLLSALEQTLQRFRYEPSAEQPQ